MRESSGRTKYSRVRENNQRFYTAKLSAYPRFISFFQYRDAIRKLLESSGALRLSFGPWTPALSRADHFLVKTARQRN
jgi:hypothetical protein